MKDKVIVITGASEGIGAATAQLLAKQGAKVALAARRMDKLAEVAASIGTDRQVLTMRVDVTRREDNEKLAEVVIGKWGGIDVWINNAGRAISRSVAELTDEDIDEMVTVNVKSVVYGIQAVLPHFKERKAGQIISLSSGLSRFPWAPQRSMYGASKAAVNLLMANLRVELRAQFPNIALTTVLPGVVATNFGLNARHGGVDNRQLPGAQPVEEVAQVIADAIENPKPEVYTRAQMLELAAKYYAAPDVTEIEAQFGQRR
jgi:NADP-dependent 3-hydroxy acid dehydrogenase YdfG